MCRAEDAACLNNWNTHCGEGIHPRWAAKQPQNLPTRFMQAHRVSASCDCFAAERGLPVARGFIPVGLQSSPKTCQHGLCRPTACQQVATATQPSGDKSPRHKDAVHIPGCCLCEERTPCGWQIYQSCGDFLWRGDLSPLGCKAAPKPASTVSTGPPRVSKWRLLRSRAGINPLATRMLFTSRDVVCVRKGLPVAGRFISHAGTSCGEGIYPRWAAKQPQNLPARFLQAHRVSASGDCFAVERGLPVARGFIPVGLQSSPKTCQHGLCRPTACQRVATATQPSGDKSPRHKDAVHIPGCCLCEERTPCGWQIYQSCRDFLWRGDLSPLGCEAAPKPASTVSTGPPRVSKWRLLRSRAGINPLATIDTPIP